MPLLAEPSSNARSGPAALSTYRLLLGEAYGLAADVERVVVVGHTTLSRPVTRLLARRDVELVVVTPHADWPDPGRAATTVAGDAVLPACKLYARPSDKGTSYLMGRLGGLRVLVMPKREAEAGDHTHTLPLAEAPEREGSR